MRLSKPLLFRPRKPDAETPMPNATHVHKFLTIKDLVQYCTDDVLIPDNGYI